MLQHGPVFDEVSGIHASGQHLRRPRGSHELWYRRCPARAPAWPYFGVLANDNPQGLNGTEGGGRFAGVNITDLFGYAPDGQHTVLKDAGIARGLSGTLLLAVVQRPRLHDHQRVETDSPSDDSAATAAACTGGP